MSRRFTEKIFILFLICLFPVLFPQRSACARTGPVNYVRGILNAVMAIQTNPKTAGAAHREERKNAIETVIEKNFDMDRMAKNALGDHWKKLDPRQRAGFTSVFRDLFQNSYTRLVLNFLKQEKVHYAPGKTEGEESLVKTVILRPNANIPVDYHLEKTKAGWRVYDVIIDGVSIVRTYHNSFNRVIMQSSFRVLMEKMRLQQKAIREKP